MMKHTHTHIFQKPNLSLHFLMKDFAGPTGPSFSVRRAEDERKMGSIEDVRGTGKHRMKVQSSELQDNSLR
jgi:hypothetical protein